jgi:hypothetical protein
MGGLAGMPGAVRLLTRQYRRQSRAWARAVVANVIALLSPGSFNSRGWIWPPRLEARSASASEAVLLVQLGPTGGTATGPALVQSKWT